MTRRTLFGALLGAASAMTLDPERLLWVPGKKLISIPKSIPKPKQWIVWMRCGNLAARYTFTGSTGICIPTCIQDVTVMETYIL